MSPTQTRDAVLLLTHSADHFTVERVAEALARRGARPVRFDTDLFPTEVRLSARLGPEGLRHAVGLGGGSGLSAGEVRAVWARKVWLPRLDERLEERFRAACARESLAALEGFLDGLGEARWVNDPARDREAENKPRQLRLAAEAGLCVPRTLLTNDPAEARAFFEEVEGRLVAKLLRPLSVGMGGSDFFVHTSDVSARDREDAASLRHSPVVFQERVEKARELRAAYVGGRFFVGAIDATRSARGRTDWRLTEPGECAWQQDGLPPDVASRLDALMKKLGLLYGAIDLILTPEGRHVFLEVNPAGEFFWLEQNPGLPISAAIADVLLGRVERRQ